MRHDRRCFGRLGQEDPRLKKHYAVGWTSLTTPRREHQGGGRWQGLRREQQGAGEDTAVAAHAVESTRVDWFGCRRQKITGGVGE